MHISLFLGFVLIMISQGGLQLSIQCNSTASRCPFILFQARSGGCHCRIAQEQIKHQHLDCCLRNFRVPYVPHLGWADRQAPV